MPTTPESIVRSFIRRINAHDPEGLVRLCTPGHIFTDSLGHRLTGRAALLPAWRGYFRSSRTTEFGFRRSSLAAMSCGVRLSAATLAGPTDLTASSWSVPAAWRAVVRHGLVAQWQVFADNKPVYELSPGPNVRNRNPEHAPR
jgi:hypothetical protein